MIASDIGAAVAPIELHEPMMLGLLASCASATVRRAEAAEQTIGSLAKAAEASSDARPKEHRRLPEPDAILTPEEVAQVLSLPKKTVIALCADGRLAGAFKAGRRWRIPGRAVRLMAGEQESKRCR